MDNPTISTCLIVYNQADYVRDCIEGALMQKTDYAYEIVIGDDCSTDRTSEICKKYAEEYPNLIRYFRREKNLGMIGNWAETIKNCNGKYIALCEGDDYWTDPFKLQKQVDFLEANSQAVGTFHVCNTIRNGEVVKTSQVVSEPIDSVEKLFNNWGQIHTLSLVFRNAAQIIPANAMQKVRAGDLLLCTYLLSRGSLHSLEDNMGNYRKHVGGVSKTYELGKELLFKSSNMLFLQELLTDERYTNDWTFIKSYLEELIVEFEQELIKANNFINNTPHSFKGFVKSKIKNTLFKR